MSLFRKGTKGILGVLLASPFGRGGCDHREQTERAPPLPCGELPPQRLRGLSIGEARKKCNGDDRRQRRIQGGAVGAAACRMRVPPKARSRRRVPQPVGSSASKSLRPCRAEHAAFASQTGLRLKSPTGAFMTSGHRRPFWFSFGAKREHPLSKPLSPAAPPPPAGPARPAGRRPAAPRSHSAPPRCRAAHAEPARPQKPLPAP